MNRGHINVNVTQNQFDIILEVSDNGVGLVSNNASGGMELGCKTFVLV